MTENLPSLVPVKDIQIMATAITKSGLFGIKTADQALALMLVAQAEGLHPATAARDYHIIQGRPALKSDAMLARYQQSGGKVQWHDYTDEKVSATFTHPAGGSIKVDWDMKRAKQAELGSKDNWKKYPRQMLRARVISEGVRATAPGCNTGFYTPEEVQDFDVKDVHPQTNGTWSEKPHETEPSENAATDATGSGEATKKPKPMTQAQAKKIFDIAAAMETPLNQAETTEVIDWYRGIHGNTYETGETLIANFQEIFNEYLDKVKFAGKEAL